MGKRQIAGQYIRHNLPVYAIAALLFISGVCLGAMSASGVVQEEAAQVSSYINTFFESDQPVNYFTYALKCAADNFKVIAVCALCSMTVYTMPVCFGFLGVKGFTTGFTTGFLIKQFAYKGALFSFAAVLPACFFALPVWFFLCGVCVRFALVNHRRAKKRSSLEKRRDTMVFGVLLLAVFVVLTLLNVLDGFLSSFVAKTLF